jgi:hypothetical protein
LALLLTPLTALTVPVAQRVWVLFDQGCILAGLWISVRLLPRPPSRTEKLALACLVLAFYPVHLELKDGQASALLFLLVALAALFWWRGWRQTAAWPIALAGSIKYYPLGFALWFLRQRAFATAALVGAGFAALVLLPDIVF